MAKSKPKTKSELKDANYPRCNAVQIRMTEKMETDVELLFDVIVGEMDKGKAKPEEKNEFIRQYFSTRDKGREALMEMYREWVNLQRGAT